MGCAKTYQTEFLELLSTPFDKEQIPVQISYLDAMKLILNTNYRSVEFKSALWFRTIFCKCSHPDLEVQAYDVITLLLRNPNILKVRSFTKFVAFNSRRIFKNSLAKGVSYISGPYKKVI